MSEDRYLDSELYLPACDRARFSWAGREYEGRLALDAGWALGLLALELEPEAYGHELYEAVFPAGSALREGLKEALAEAERTASRLRFRLHLSPGLPDWIHALYWELLADDGGRLSLARSPDTAFSRYSTVRCSLGLPTPGRARLLCAVAAPLDAARFRLAEIDRDAVLDRLIAVFGESYRAYEVEILEPPVTLERMRERLVSGGFHLLHLVGHGLIESRGVSALVLEDTEGKARFVGEELLAELLLGVHELRFVTLMACHGGAPSSPDSFSGLAGRLVERGLPAVLAMRRRISFADAELFTLHLYRHLARAGRVDVAVNEARQQLYLKDPQGITWSSPVLYSRLADGSLWQPEVVNPPPAVTIISSFPRRRSALYRRHLLPLVWLPVLLALWFVVSAHWPSVVNKLQISSPSFQSFFHDPKPVVLQRLRPTEAPAPAPSVPGRPHRPWVWLTEPPVSSAPQSSNPSAAASATESSLSAFDTSAPPINPHPVASLLEPKIRFALSTPDITESMQGPGREDQPEVYWSEEKVQGKSSSRDEGDHLPSCSGEKPLFKLGLVMSALPKPLNAEDDTVRAEVLREATEAFVTSLRFFVIERSKLAAIFKEKDLKNFLGRGDGRLSDLLGLDCLGIVEYSVNTKTIPTRITKKLFEKLDPKGSPKEEVQITVWTIDVRLVDVKTGQIAKTLSSASSSSLVPVPSVREAGQLLRDSIRAAYPPFGIITKVNGKEVTIDLGESAGLQKSDVLEIVEEGEQIFDPATAQPLGAYLIVIGQIQITDLWPNMANATITTSALGKEIEAGHFVRYKSGSGGFLRKTLDRKSEIR